MIRKILTMTVAALAVTVSVAASAESARVRRAGEAITWSQSMQLLKDSGYTHPVIIQSAADGGGWIGLASKDGRRVDIAVDPQGNVSQH